MIKKIIEKIQKNYFVKYYIIIFDTCYKFFKKIFFFVKNAYKLQSVKYFFNYSLAMIFHRFSMI